MFPMGGIYAVPLGNVVPFSPTLSDAYLDLDRKNANLSGGGDLNLPPTDC